MCGLRAVRVILQTCCFTLMVVYYCVHPVSCNQALTCFNFTHKNCLHKLLVEPLVSSLLFSHELVFFFIIFLLWELLNDDIYTMHMFSLKLASFM